MEILDVGCGSRPWGTVNLDFNLGRSDHHPRDYDPKRIPNFVRGDGVHLPFRSKCFTRVLARHVLEHIPDPLGALREWARVAQSQVILMVPNNPGLEDHRTHLYAWSRPALANLLALVFPRVQVYPNSPLKDLYKIPGLRRILRAGGYKKPVNRLIGSLMGLQLTAICEVKPDP